MRAIHTDICIVGSGMGGGTLALSLARRGTRALLVEAGGATASDASDIIGPIEYSGRPFGIPQTRAIELGGTTNLWHGVTSTLDLADFLVCGEDNEPLWPLSFTSMLPYWQRAFRFLGFNDSTLTSFDQLHGSLKEEVSNVKLNSLYFQPKLFRVLQNPTRLKTQLLEAPGSLGLMLNTCVKRLAWSSDFTRCMHLIAYQGEAETHIFAKRFVIAAGALETPRILLNSQPFGCPESANQHIGRWLMDHPKGYLGKLDFKRPTRARLFADLKRNAKERLRVGLAPRNPTPFGNSNLYLRPTLRDQGTEVEQTILRSLIAARGVLGLTPSHIRSIVQNPSIAYRLLAKRYSLPISYHGADLFFVTEQSPNWASRVSLANSVDRFGYRGVDIEWRLSASDMERMEEMLAAVCDGGLNGHRCQIAETPTLSQWEQSLSSAAHHLGTMRMSRSPSAGVVDTNLKMHHLKNVWVCDASVFPSGGNANPSLTICALALRLADHLIND